MSVQEQPHDRQKKIVLFGVLGIAVILAACHFGYDARQKPKPRADMPSAPIILLA